MYVEFTQTSGAALKINVLSIDTIQPAGNDDSIFSKQTLISTSTTTHYVRESYNEVSSKIDEALAKLPMELAVFLKYLYDKNRNMAIV